YRAERIVDLHEPGFQARRAELLLAKKTGEKAPVVAALFELDQMGALERRIMKFHADGSSGKVRMFPAQIGAEPAGGHMTLQRLQPHIGRIAELLIGEAHPREAVAQ